MTDKRGALLCFAWIASIILTGSLLWFFTRPVRTRMVIRAANGVLEKAGETRRLQSPVNVPPPGGPLGPGMWFTLTEVSGGSRTEGAALVFTLHRGAQAAACAAFVDGPGGFEKFVPLSAYAAQVLDNLPGAVYAMYREWVVNASKTPGMPW
ncbi:MAG: hypothetical protein LBI67_00330 [Treponema sp.]|jgi:hypothetical protein|nr:hypothetical protein [Treponema sp.]